MGTVKFNNNGSFIFSTLAAAVANAPTGAHTIACVFKRVAVTADYDGLAYLNSAGPTAQTGMSIEAAVDGSHLLMDVGLGGSPPAGVAAGSATENYGAVIGKAAGTVAPRYSIYTKSNTTITHGNHSTASANRAACTTLEIGAWQSTDWGNQWMAVIGIWNVDIVDANRAALFTNWRTSDFYNHASGTPVCLIELNTATPTDLIGNVTARSTSGTGPTLDAAETIGSWNFDGTGGAAAATAPPLRRPRPRLRGLIIR